MKKTITIILIALAAYLLIFIMIRNMKKKQYLSYLHNLGFGVADRMTFSELQDAYNYLYNYARRYSSNAASIVLATNPTLYVRLQNIIRKYGAIFNLNTATSDTNIPNIQTPVGVAPIIPDVKLPTAQNPSTSGGNIIPPTLNIV